MATLFVSDSLETDLVTITPEVATQLLTQNTRNREISRSNVEKLKLSLACGEWRVNGEAIKQLKFTMGGAKPESFPEPL